MIFDFRMKTGFFETKMLELHISKGKIILSPKEPDDQLIAILEENVLAITMRKSKKSFEMEIQTNEKIYQGILDNKIDYEKFVNQIKENINKKIICEYEGGS
ncbi:MAG: hypothetical protein SA378_04340 [Sedimentibacter sp.]|uniref:hypothetical protein n=1 Tax=Sedimentibacter sp. TaxID=1960295 RepID=UPI0029824636|nr:hypothetical protein [Sedimentibacter sp.]MDW5299352.1 hypothetical protein [Sedimentibacter sp.]